MSYVTLRHLKVAMSASTLSMDLGDSRYKWHSDGLKVLSHQRHALGYVHDRSERAGLCDGNL